VERRVLDARAEHHRRRVRGGGRQLLERLAVGVPADQRAAAENDRLHRREAPRRPAQPQEALGDLDEVTAREGAPVSREHSLVAHVLVVEPAQVGRAAARGRQRARIRAHAPRAGAGEARAGLGDQRGHDGDGALA
jgi:hypothetical protein